jgi:uroporphyrinogen-III synthase
MGLEAFTLPLFAIEPLPWTASNARIDALLLTSANAVRQAGRQLEAFLDLPAYAVGPGTAAAAWAAGLSPIDTGNAGVDALLERISPELRLLHLCGEHRRGPSVVRSNLTSVPVYRAAELANPRGLERLNGALALVHSPRAGSRLAELVSQRSSIAVAAISPAAAEACGRGWESVQAAEQPGDDALLSLAARLCKQSPPK